MRVDSIKDDRAYIIILAIDPYDTIVVNLNDLKLATKKYNLAPLDRFMVMVDISKDVNQLDQFVIIDTETIVNVCGYEVNRIID